MTREERELSIEYLEGIKDNYIEGYGYERHPLPEYYAIENAIKALEQEPTDKIDCQHTDEEIAKSFIEDVEAVKDQLPTTKNDLGVDAVSRDSVIKALDYDIESFEFKSGVSKYMEDIAKLLNTIYEIQVNNIKALPSVTPQESIDYKAQYESFKKKAEIVISQLRADRDRLADILDKLRAEIESIIGERSLDDYDFCSGLIVARKLIDKYKAESEDNNAEIN